MKRILVCSVMALGTMCSYAQEAVDLGLSVLWSNMNLGAKTPYEDGDYFAWAETKPKDNYSWETYFDIKTIKPSLSFKFFVNRGDIEETMYDAARMNLGDNWRMPTLEDWKELYDKCKINIVRSEGVVEVTGPNGNSIIFPHSGMFSGNTKKYPTYLEPTLWTSVGWGNGTALAVEIYSSPSTFTSYSFQDVNINKFCGLPIRPVKDSPEVIAAKKKKAYEKELVKSSTELIDNAYQLYNRGQSLLDEGKDGTYYFKQADEKLKRVGNKNEYTITALYLHTRIKSYLRDYDEMKRIAELLVNEVNINENNDENDLSILLYGYLCLSAYYQEKNLTKYNEYNDKCNEVANKIITINPSNLTARDILKTVPAKSLIQDYHDNPDNEDLYKSLSDDYIAKGQIEEVIKLADERITKYPESSLPHFYKGYIFMLDKKYEDAISELSIVKDDNTVLYLTSIYNRAVCKYNMASAFLETAVDSLTGDLIPAENEKFMNMLNDAQNDFEMAKELDPNQRTVKWAYLLKNIYIITGQKEKANAIQ